MVVKLTKLTGATEGQIMPRFGSYMQFKNEAITSGLLTWDHKLTVLSFKFNT